MIRADSNSTAFNSIAYWSHKTPEKLGQDAIMTDVLTWMSLTQWQIDIAWAELPPGIFMILQSQALGMAMRVAAARMIVMGIQGLLRGNGALLFGHDWYRGFSAITITAAQADKLNLNLIGYGQPINQNQPFRHTAISGLSQPWTPDGYEDSRRNCSDCMSILRLVYLEEACEAPKGMCKLQK